MVENDKRATTAVEQKPVEIDVDSVRLQGMLAVPEGVQGVVVFVHSNGARHFGSRNRYVAETMHAGGLATLLFNLLTPEEEELDLHTRHMRFDINILARRTLAAVDWVHDQSFARALKIGLFGSSTGAAAALIAASERPECVGAVVSRGGRPDLAANALGRVQSPTLLIVGSLDYPVIELNELALAHMDPRPMKEMAIVPGATHLFEENGAMQQVARLATEWFQRFLPPGWHE